jgi:hypothetical protein
MTSFPPTGDRHEPEPQSWPDIPSYVRRGCSTGPAAAGAVPPLARGTESQLGAQRRSRSAVQDPGEANPPA